VSRSSSTYEGTKGTVVWETRNTLHIRSKAKTCVVPKRGNVFAFEVNGKKVSLDGASLERDPIERTKKGMVV
jgi:RNase P/RNase MRP subunit p29